MIYRAIDSGMVSFRDVKEGAVSLAELAEINSWLDMKADIEWANRPDAKREGRGRNARR